MKPFRSIAGIFRKYAVPVSINLLGLVTALTAFIIIMSHVEFERNYDRSYPTSGRIFRVDCPGNEETFRSILPAREGTIWKIRIFSVSSLFEH